MTPQGDGVHRHDRRPRLRVRRAAALAQPQAHALDAGPRRRAGSMSRLDVASASLRARGPAGRCWSRSGRSRACWSVEIAKRMPTPSKVLNAAVDRSRSGELPARDLAKPRPRVRRLRRGGAHRDSARPRDGQLARRRAQPRSAGRELPADRRDRDAAARDPVDRHRDARRRVFIVAYAAFFPIVINTIAGVKRVDRNLLQAAATMGLATVDDAAHGRRSRRAAVDRRRHAHRASASRGRRSSPPSSPSARRPAAAAPAASAR